MSDLTSADIGMLDSSMKERNFFTQKRKEQLDSTPKLQQTEQWGEYNYIPLDIPRFDYPELVDWFFEKCQPTYKKIADIASANYGDGSVSSFDAVDVLARNETDHRDIWTLNVQQEFLTKFSHIYERILSEFPFKSLDRIRFWSSTDNIVFHRDHTKFIDYPSSFRIMLYDTNLIPTLSLVPSLPDTPNEFAGLFPIKSIPETNSFVWNNLRTKHGSNYIPPFKKIVIILDRYDLDIDRYNDLMVRSVEKFKSHAMISNHSLESFVNL